MHMVLLRNAWWVTQKTLTHPTVGLRLRKALPWQPTMDSFLAGWAEFRRASSCRARRQLIERGHLDNPIFLIGILKDRLEHR